MKNLKQALLGLAGVIALAAVFFTLLQSLKAQSSTPVICNFYSMQHPDRPSLPAPLFPGLQIYYLSNNAALFDDTAVDYDQLQQEAEALAALEWALGLASPPGSQSESGGNEAELMFMGDCTGYLLPPVYQVTNVVLSLTNVTSGDEYDLYSAPYLLPTNWTYLGRWTNTAASWTLSNPPTNESYYFVGCVDDADHEGLADVYEAVVSHTDPNDPDTDYDGRNDYEEYILEGTLPLDATSFTPVRLGYFRFNTAGLQGERGQLPLVTNNLQSVDAWITKGVQLTNSASQLKYNTVENDGKANINLRSGTVRTWFKPLWTSGPSGGPGSAARFLEVGTPNSNGWWAVFLDSKGTNLFFASQTNGAGAVTNLTASVSFVSNNWYQIALTFTNGAFALYTNSVLAATNTGTLAYPGLAVRSNGFSLGCDTSGANVAKGVFEDLETFNYPLNPNDILENFQLTQPPMLIPNLKLWLKADLIAATNSARVSEWKDQSGFANDAFQGTLNSQPILATNGIAGKPSIFFPGTNNYFTIPPSMLTGVKEGEIFIVLQAATNTPTQNRGLWLFYVGSSSSYYPATSGTISDGFGTADFINTGFPSQPLDVPHFYNVVSRTNEWTSRINGVIHLSRNSATPRFDVSLIRLGLSDGANYFSGYISEVLVYGNALNDAERFAVSSYLGQRYGLVTLAPAVPTNLFLFAVSPSQVSLTWSHALTATNTSFVVERRSGSAAYFSVGMVQNSLSYLDTGLAAGTTYYYRIKAVNYSGQEASSAETTVTTPGTGTALPLASLKVWLKADSGFGGTSMNCWVDQTTNHFTAYHPQPQNPTFILRPTWSATNLNGHPAVEFDWTNGFYLPNFPTGWTQGEVYVVLQSLGPNLTTNCALWLMGTSASPSDYPFTNGYIHENFGQLSGSMTTPVPSGFQLGSPHLYNVASSNGFWGSWLNNAANHATDVNTVGFNTVSRLGWGTSGNYFRGSISELMIFDRVLTTAERDCIATNYLRHRYELW